MRRSSGRSWPESWPTLVIVYGGAGVATYLMTRPSPIEDGSYLVIPLHGALPEYTPPVGALGAVAGGDGEHLTRVLENLRKAAADERIAGVVLETSYTSAVGWAAMEEIRGCHRARSRGGQARGRLRGEAFDSRGLYLLAACDEIVMPPPGQVLLTGFASTSTHVRSASIASGLFASTPMAPRAARS